MGSSSKVTVGYWYGMGLHFGLCHGPVDELHQIKVGDRDAWCGSVTDNATVDIDAEELFGGKKKEGGVVGSLDVLMGGASQTANSYLTSKIGTPMPAFKGILSAVMNASKIAANNPYIKPWAFRVERILQGWSGGSAWYPEKAPINTIQIIYEESFNEDFLNPAEYTTSGSGSYFSIVTTPYGQGMKITNTEYEAVPGGNYKYRAVPAHQYDRIEFVCKIDGNADGAEVTDTDIATIVFGNSSGAVVHIQLSRDASGTGSAERAQINGQNIGSTKLVVGEWYQVTLELDWVAATLDYTVRNNGTNAMFATGSVAFTTTGGVIDKITFDVDVPEHERLNDAGTYADIWLYTTECTTYNDLNPAHIIYQCLTDSVWGMGYPISALDDASFTSAADTLYAEHFGLSMIWNRQDSLESFIRVVLDHIGSILYVDPSTGKFALKLIRDDYDRNTLPIYGPSNLITASDYQRQAWGETVNEITVVYTDPCVNKGTSVTVQDLANIQTQGAVIAQTRQYPGITNPTLAQRVAMRDLLVFSTPLAKIKLSATRAAWDLIPGDVFRLTWPEYGIDDVVYRVLEVNRGTLQNGSITIEAVEDVFGMPDSTYVSTQGSGWTDPSSAPAPATYRKLVEAPYWDIARSLSAADLAMLDPLSGYLETLAVRPSSDSISYEINSKVGSASYEARATGQFCPAAVLNVALTKTTTSITFNGMVNADLVETGGYAIIDDEYIGITAIDAAAGTATITRGLLDTVPAEHSVGASIWFVDGYQGVDATEYADGEQVDVKLLPRTGQGELDISLAPTDSMTMDQRHNRPYPPGRVLVNGSAYPDWISGSAELALSWAHRDRLSQTAYLVTQGENSIGPEAGTAYNLRIYGETDTLIRTVNQATTTYLYTAETEKSDSLIEAGNDAAYWVTELTGATSSAYLSTCSADGSDVVAFGTNNADSSTRGDVHVVKFSGASGTVMWQKSATRAGHEILPYGTVDSAGKLRAVGREYASSYYRGASMSLNSDGTFSSYRDTSSSENAQWLGVCAGPSESVYVGGNNASGQGRIAKLASDNTFSISKTVPGMDSIYAPKIDGSYVYFPGFTPATYAACIFKVPSDLSTITWARKLAGSTSTYSGSLAIDGSGNVYGSAHVSDVNKGMYLFKYNSSGILQWQRRVYNGSNLFYRASVTVVSDGVIFTGSHNGSAGVIVKYNAAGTIQWQYTVTHSSGSVGFGNEAILIGDIVFLVGNVASVRFFCMKLPASGPTAGTYGAWTFTASSFTEAAGDLTDSAASLSLGAWSPTSASQTPTVASTSFTESSVSLGGGEVAYRINGRLRIELESLRDGLASYQKHNHAVLREGYGFNYGYYWGGQP
jgi:hypothetical protein